MNKPTILALFAIIPSWIALFLTEQKEVLVSLIIGLVLGLTLIIFLWLSCLAIQDVLAIKRDRRLHRDLSNKYRNLNKRIESVFSCSHSHSIFQLWHSFTNTKNNVYFDLHHYQAIYSWLMQVVNSYSGFEAFPSKMRGFSVAVSESTRLAEKAQIELQGLCNNNEFSADDRRRLKQEWSNAREEYNDWLRESRKFFEEVNKKLPESDCCVYFQFVKTLE